MKTYDELCKLGTFEERYEYLKLNSKIGIETFGWDRYLNQVLYSSHEWKTFRNKIILRDNGCDLGISDYPIFYDRITVHHINPVTKSQILNRDPILFDMNNAISCTHDTHMAIHYGTLEKVDRRVIERTINDTCPWRH